VHVTGDVLPRRFHAAKRGFTERKLTYLTNVDGDDHFALIATERDRPDRLVAIARFIRNPREPQEAELAITVHDPYQHTGVGQRMLGLLITAADEHNVTRFRAIVQTENRPMVTLLHKMLPNTELSLRDGSTIEYVSRLSDSTRLAA
jgi:RimJ/RimL family protein N-acetyltransferase